MNQSILFPDLQDWDAQTQTIVFPVQVQGANIECRISLSKLVSLSLAGSTLNENDVDIGERALALFEEYRFDIEEEVEKLIELESYDELGRVAL